MSKILISLDREKLDISYIHDFISNSYWGKGRTIETVKKSIKNSRCYGVYFEGKQIGFARVVTDTVIFAYFMDVFIDKAHNGKGYAQQLMKFIMNDPELSEVSKWYLRTLDAHSLYEKLGFKPLAQPENSMEIWKKI